jgi:F-type H+-transporting ATPase subunit b
VNIIPDLILALTQVVPFLVLVAGLQVIIFKPMLNYLHDRAAATVGAKHDAAELVKRSEGRLAEYEAQLAKVRSELTEYRAALRTDAQKAQAHHVAEARRESEVHLHGALAAIQREAAVARKAVASMSKDLAGDIASSVLGRAVEPS